MKEELVSIIVPVYNVEKYISQTMDCVRSQTYTNWELLLIDDRSTDATPEKIKEYMERVQDERIRLVTLTENEGVAKVRNRGVALAKGRYISYLDADDIWVPEKLEKELAFMQKKDAAFAFTGYEFADEAGVGRGIVVRVPETLTYRQALKNTTIFTTTVIFDTTKIAKENLMMPEIKSEDTALWWKVLRQGYVAYGLDENLVKYRRIGHSLSSNKIEAIKRIWNLYRTSEGLGVLQSAWYFCFWAVNAVRRRL